MHKNIFEDHHFEGTDYTQNGLEKGRYENCVFKDCLLSGSDLSEVVFLECTFRNCDLSMAALKKTALRDVRFQDCKLMGLHFDDCHDFLFKTAFEGCLMNYATFCQFGLKGTVFSHCNLEEADFTAADLTAAEFDHCDLTGAIFEDTILNKADFRTATNYAMDPEKNRLAGAKFSTPGVLGLLVKYGIEVDGSGLR